MPGSRRSAYIDGAVDRAVRGERPAPAPKSNKQPWERAGMSREEYSRGLKQLADERSAEIRRRDGQTTDSNNP